MGRRALAFLAAAACASLVGVPLATSGPAGAQPADVAGAPVNFGDAPALGSVPGPVAAPEVGMARTPSGNGYWIVGSDGGIFSFGDAAYHGSMGGQPLAAPIVGMAATPDGLGYWEVAADGGVFTFGDAGYFGSMGGQPLAAPIVAMAPTPDGLGYWEVAADGGVFTFGDAGYFGSMGGQPLVAPVVGMARTPSGDGYYEVASDGGIFTFGDARFQGSAARNTRAQIAGIALTPDGGGYWLASSSGGVFSYGDAPFLGSMGGQTLASPVVSLVATPDGGGYWLLPSEAPREAWGVPPVSLGSSGPAVLNLQQQLTDFGYWLGTPNGVFGDSTQQAVWALQKAAGIGRTGVADFPTYTALSQGVVPQPRSTSGYVIDVDLEDDLVMFVDNGQVVHILNTSTGGGYTYDGGTVAITPTGHFQIYRVVDGLVVDNLGALWRPRYFTGGFAIHGDTNVPPEPVSHGCVRVSNEAIDWIWTTNEAPLGTTVWVY